MARYIDPKCRLCRREGVKLFLKGERCEGPKCALTRKQQAPGQHGTSRRRPTEYAVHLREKQKVKRIYGVGERQFRNYFEKARKAQADTGERLLQILEMRLDNLVYRLGFSVSRAQARKMIGDGHITVSGKKVTIPSFEVKKGVEISTSDPKWGRRREPIIPDWLIWDGKKGLGKIKTLPNRDQLDTSINERLIVEFYSR